MYSVILPSDLIHYLWFSIDVKNMSFMYTIKLFMLLIAEVLEPKLYVFPMKLK